MRQVCMPVCSTHPPPHKKHKEGRKEGKEGQLWCYVTRSRCIAAASPALSSWSRVIGRLGDEQTRHFISQDMWPAQCMQPLGAGQEKEKEKK